MNCFVYILYSKSVDKFYVGQTDSLETRLASHNSGKSPFTSIASDWELVYFETYDNRTDARKREYEIKRKKSRKYIEWLLSVWVLRASSGWCTAS